MVLHYSVAILYAAVFKTKRTNFFYSRVGKSGRSLKKLLVFCFKEISEIPGHQTAFMHPVAWGQNREEEEQESLVCFSQPTVFHLSIASGVVTDPVTASMILSMGEHQTLVAARGEWRHLHWIGPENSTNIRCVSICLMSSHLAEQEHRVHGRMLECQICTVK